MKASTQAIDYYSLDPNTATMRDVIIQVRADEAVHRSVNHHFSDIPQFYSIHHDTVNVVETEDQIEERAKLLLEE
jgi:hypothetical protein